MPSPKEIVGEVCRLFAEQRGMDAVERYFAPDYVEHNPEVPDGSLDGFRALLVREGLDEPRGRAFEMTVLNLIAECPDVAVHLKVSEPDRPPLIIMEIYRVRDGRIVEHWDVMQSMPAKPVNRRHAMA